MQDNLNYFKYSRDNPEPPLDEYYVFAELDPKLEVFAEKTKKIKEVLTAIKVAFDNNQPQDSIERLFKILQGTIQQNSNRSEFLCFANACDTVLDVLKDEENSWLLKEITKLYLEKRNIVDITPKEWVQALCDSQASKKKGKAGEKKLINLCRKSDCPLVAKWEHFKQYKQAVAKFSKSKINLNIIRDNLGVRFEARNQEKLPDLLIKKDDKWIIVEAKHQTVGGGTQNHKITELTDLLSMSQTDSSVKFVAFLDGNYSNFLLKLADKQIEKKEPITEDNKYAAQQRDIVRLLHQNHNNYWLNTAGFIKFIDEI
ncbi:MAG: hypothetical protein CVV39_05430 [Planctomycetes bacterium HGW-Planctomycetes-1]|nr:MAG: hypothetical protein CVV39_05430 [Planctomycetes bacterium HGW-Planctomycetes-1]